MFRTFSDKSSFTLIELLVVIGVLGTLATAVVIVLNPAELLKEARDSTRFSDLASLNRVISLFQTDQYNRPLGTSSIIYVSVPDVSSTCGNLGLPILPNGLSYNCVTSANLQKTDGTGWLPMNLSLISSGSPLSKLPTDSVNSTSSGMYYAYITDGTQWKMMNNFEAAKNIQLASNDNGSDFNFYEAGSNLTLANFTAFSATFDSGTSPWQYQYLANGTSTQTGEQFLQGNQSLKITRTVAGNEANVWYGLSGLQNSTRYYYSAWVYPGASNTGCLFTYNGSVDMAKTCNVGSGRWELVSGYFTSSVTGSTQLRLAHNVSSADISSVYFDAVQVKLAQ